ncbi:unnamed protein product [Malassezia sympodialis ATCC 42132]|uniref:uncharacterized protein n=1 Tax=Malassezia sympodialis (strain ATCC 42132) TaxID=1230383 RepID=UPI0002C250F8|nr:uncharacterized protein MSY001_2996 [Malassezia sympodialis ATCC 42132]CCV00291.1 unnamed protein product [Malassezia sympodialis ATCC 42132]|eukprot:XP_018741496.1 uncharacterized protein MSY001_2996 [Malassezia sympodialis ATCC 42132]
MAKGPPAETRARRGGAHSDGVASDAQSHASSVPLLLALCVLWYTSSALTSNTSKSLLSRPKVAGEVLPGAPLFPYPVTLTLVQFVFVNLFCYLGTRRSLLGEFTLAKRLVRISWQQMREIVQISIFNVLGHALSSLAVSHVEVSLVHTIKALSPLFTVLSYALFFRVPYSLRTYVALVPLMTGVVLACSSLSKNKREDMVGFAAALGSTLIVVAQNIYSKKLLKPAVSAATNAPEKLDKVNILFYSSACSVVLMLPMTLYYDVGHMAARTAPGVGLYTLYLLVSNGIVHFAQNLLAFQVLAHVSPVTYSVANLFKRVFVILVAIAWFGQRVTAWQWVGIALTFVGLYLYNNAKNDKPNAPDAPREPEVLPMHQRSAMQTRRIPDTNAMEPGALPHPTQVKMRMATPLFSLPPHPCQLRRPRACQIGTQLLFWNRWNQSAPSAWSDVEWLDVVYGRQRYQVTLPQIQGALTLGHLRQELAAVFSLPVQQVLVAFQGLFLKDDRVSLQEYGLHSGSRITLVARDAYVQQAQARAQASAQAQGTQGTPQGAPQGGAAGGLSAQDAESLPSAAPTMAPVARAGAAPAAPPAQDAGAGAPGTTDAPSHLEQIAQVSQHCQRDLVPELELLEKTIEALPDAPPGSLQSQAPHDASGAVDEACIPPQRIPLTQRKLSELLLRELLKLDGIPTDSEEVRNTRKATVKEIQAYLDRVDAAWGRATQAKGIVSDV